MSFWLSAGRMIDGGWGDTVSRLDMTKSQIAAKNYDLKPSFKVTVYEEVFTITGENVY